MEDLTCLSATVRTLNNYGYHKLAKFDQNQMIRITQNFAFLQKAVSHVKHSDSIISAILKEVSASETISWCLCI